MTLTRLYILFYMFTFCESSLTTFACFHYTVNILRAVKAAPTASVPCLSLSSLNVARPRASRASVSTTCQQTPQSSSTRDFDAQRSCDNQEQPIALEPQLKQTPLLLPASRHLLRTHLRKTQRLNTLIITNTRPVKAPRLLRPPQTRRQSHSYQAKRLVKNQGCIPRGWIPLSLILLLLPRPLRDRSLLHPPNLLALYLTMNRPVILHTPKYLAPCSVFWGL